MAVAPFALLRFLSGATLSAIRVWYVLGLLLGFSMFRNGVNIYYTLSHFVATVVLSYFTTSMWSYEDYWTIMITFRCSRRVDRWIDSLTHTRLHCTHTRLTAPRI